MAEAQSNVDFYQFSGSEQSVEFIGALVQQTYEMIGKIFILFLSFHVVNVKWILGDVLCELKSVFLNIGHLFSVGKIMGRHSRWIRLLFEEIDGVSTVVRCNHEWN